MTRAISVLVATLVLLSVGWYVGHLPVRRQADRMKTMESAFQDELLELTERALLAEGRGYLWQARAELVLAAHEIDQRNFGSASRHAQAARDLVVRAAGVPGLRLNLETTQNAMDAAMTKLGAMDPAGRESVLRAASELERLLERTGQA